MRSSSRMCSHSSLSDSLDGDCSSNVFTDLPRRECSQYDTAVELLFMMTARTNYRVARASALGTISDFCSDCLKTCVVRNRGRVSSTRGREQFLDFPYKGRRHSTFNRVWFSLPYESGDVVVRHASLPLNGYRQYVLFHPSFAPYLQFLCYVLNG